MKYKLGAVSLLLAAVFTVAVAGPAFAHNVTFRATVSVGADGTSIDVYVDDVIRNPVPNGIVTVTSGGASAALVEGEPGQYRGELSRPVQSGDRLTVQVEVGSGKENKWSGSGNITVGGTSEWVLFHQHGVDGRTFSIVMTIVFGSLLAVIAVYEMIRLRRRRQRPVAAPPSS